MEEWSSARSGRTGHVPQHVGGSYQSPFDSNSAIKASSQRWRYATIWSGFCSEYSMPFAASHESNGASLPMRSVITLMAFLNPDLRVVRMVCQSNPAVSMLRLYAASASAWQMNFAWPIGYKHCLACLNASDVFTCSYLRGFTSSALRL